MGCVVFFAVLCLAPCTVLVVLLYLSVLHTSHEKLISFARRCTVVVDVRHCCSHDTNILCIHMYVCVVKAGGALNHSNHTCHTYMSNIKHGTLWRADEVFHANECEAAASSTTSSSSSSSVP